MQGGANGSLDTRAYPAALVNADVFARCYASVFARSRQKRLSRMKESRGGRNGGTSPVRPRRGETRRTGGDRTADVTGRRKDGARAGREKESERAKRKAGVHNGSEKQSETYELILIGGDSGEYGLREYEGLVRLLLEVHDRLRRARVRPLHQVDPRLVLVHGVQDQLQIIATVSDEMAHVRK